MPTCRGNRGNLMQHWVLCELIEVMKRNFAENSHLLYVDAYPMAPFARLRGVPDPAFRDVRRRLPGRSTYESAWYDLTREHPEKYPSSLVFIGHLWRGRLSVCLSEKDKKTFNEIDRWINAPERATRFEHSPQIYRGDWRRNLTTCSIATDADAVFMSFDPNKYDLAETTTEEK